jgi:purine-binding chemotaxis protein CheW
MRKNTRESLDELIQLVSFRLDQEEFGIDILKVQEINRMVEITRVPQAPSYCEGVINLRGKVIPVIDLRTKFGLAARGRDKDSRIVVCDVTSHQIGMIVDSVQEVLRIPQSSVEDIPQIVTSVGQDYIRGVAKLDDRLLMFLDIAKIADEVSSSMETQEDALATA